MMIRVLIVVIGVCTAQCVHADSGSLRVKSTPITDHVVVRHGEALVTIERRQEPNSTINPAYTKIFRDCPPHRIKPLVVASGVETIGELETRAYLKRITDGDDLVTVIDSRTPTWLKEGSIPGSINIPWAVISPAAGADPFEVADLLEAKFGAIARKGLWNFAASKTFVLYL